MNMSLFVKKVLIPTKLKFAKSLFGKHEVAVLDIGCGNQSFEIAKSWLNVRLYHGVDKEHWLGQDDDYKKMDKVFYVDLDVQNCLSDIPDGLYDLVIVHHVVEHLARGYELIPSLYNKLAPGGLLYIETPSERTINFPSGIGFLNFYDDATHKKIYPVLRLVEVCMECGFQISKFGVRRDWTRLILFAPLAILWNIFYSLPVRRKIDARGLWDLLGVASYVVARRPKAI